MKRRGWWVGLILAAAPASCGGVAFDAGTPSRDAGVGGVDSGGGGGDGAVVPPDGPVDGGAGGDGASSPCPANQPSSGVACTREGLECEYGTSPVTACNAVATCTQLLWVLTPPNSSGGVCRGGLDSQCPQTYALVPKGSHCTDLNLVCDYPRGRCACEGPTGGPITSMLDASAAANWACQAGTVGCPDVRPLLGTACSPNAAVCDYGSCTVPNGTTEQCVAGVWESLATACAVAL